MLEIPTVIQSLAVKAGFDMLYLVTCSIHGIVPEQNRVEQMDLAQLYRVAKNHSLTAMVCMALETAGALSDNQDAQLIGKWKDAKEKAIRKNLMLDTERNKILSFMEREGIWYLPLKGILLKELYPKLGMRQMADNDILYDRTFQEELYLFMTARGYRACEIGKGNHDIYYKEPVYNYELHTALFGTLHDKNWEIYYRDVKKRLIKDDANQYGYHFKEEDFYIYLMTHNYKHYSGGGTGIRSLLDLYVFLKQKEAGLNWHYIGAELEELHITEFEYESRQLCRKLFSEKTYPLTQKELETLSYYLASGTYGTLNNKIEKKLSKYQPDHKQLTVVTRIRYYMDRLLPDEDHYKNYAPFVYKHRWLTPFYLIFRVVRGLIRKRKMIQRELQVLHSFKR